MKLGRAVFSALILSSVSTIEVAMADCIKDCELETVELPDYLVEEGNVSYLYAPVTVSSSGEYRVGAYVAAVAPAVPETPSSGGEPSGGGLVIEGGEGLTNQVLSTLTTIVTHMTAIESEGMAWVSVTTAGGTKFEMLVKYKFGRAKILEKKKS